MDEPTLAEEVRRLADRVQNLVDVQQHYVTKEILELKLQALAKDQEDLEKAVADDRARVATLKNWVWSAVVAPVIVGLILYAVIGKTP